ncbi:MAG: mannose-6-phosphate isomerase [Naasia sp.]|uniref:mannose-6-phosphate isomerase, class I n=1 Tax=Naasia sp. TaxID=2546198 RepID=UPI002605A63F|nr:mannose-6-phosphate isomerase, class I [Naasia sp.]MCU1570370.1 mannose-6-phosphate isomerase [Naasia sp.]
MFVGITNTPRDYAWGSPSAIAELLGRAPSGKPEAELWLGAHPLAPSRIVQPELVGGHADLAAWIAADPSRTLGERRTSDTLPFLLKILAADQPLSIQAHPSPEQAREGFARENDAGVPVHADSRLYKDDRHKPELALALSATFEALAGFRDVSFTRLLIAELVALARGSGEDGDVAALQGFDELLTGPGDAALRRAVDFALGGSAAAAALIEVVCRLAERGLNATSYGRELETIAELGRRHPGDPGILVALLLNRVSLAQGQALYLPSGNIHAYLRGLAVEIMAASDNVLRGGITSKHVDREELQRVVLFEPVPAPLLRAEEFGPGVEVFRPDVPDFQLARVTVGASGARHGYRLTGEESAILPLSGPSIAICLEGAAEIVGRTSATSLGRGESVYVTPDEEELTFTGSAVLFVAGPNA